MKVKFSQGTNYNNAIQKWICEDKEELKNIIAPIGSSCYVIHDKETYMIDSKGTWYTVSQSSTSAPVECDCVEEMTIWADIPEGGN